jgi:voltage-gated potassium channel
MTWGTLGKLCLIYINLMTAIIVINFNLVIMSTLIPGMDQPFAFSSGSEALIDAIYFSIVLMTTVGFGDIHPLSAVAKCIVAVECLVGYVMFAVLIGLVVRGVSSDPAL